MKIWTFASWLRQALLALVCANLIAAPTLAQVRQSALPTATSITGGETVTGLQGGVNKNFSVSSLGGGVVTQKLMRAMSRAQVSNPVIAPLSTECTVSESATASGTATNAYLAATLSNYVTLTGGKPTLDLVNGTRMAFPSVAISPSTRTGNIADSNLWPLNLNGHSAEITTVTDSPVIQFDLNVPATSRAYRVAIDGQYITSKEPTAYAASGRRYLIVDCAGVRNVRRIRLETSQSRTSLYGVYVVPTSNIRKVTNLEPVIQLAAGDSYGEGTGAAYGGLQSYQKYLGLRLFSTAVDTRIVAMGSTGYVSANFGTATANTTNAGSSIDFTVFPSSRTLDIGQPITGPGIQDGTTITGVGTYTVGGTSATGVTLSKAATATATGVTLTVQARYPLADQVPGWATVNSDIDPAKVDLITLLEGYNDTSFPPATVAAQATRAYTAMRAAYPNAYIFVFGVAPGIANNSGTTTALENAISAAVTGMNDPKIVFFPISTATPPVMFGTGYTGATNGSGNTDTLMSSDGVHPSTAGHNYLAEYMAAQIRAWFAKLGSVSFNTDLPKVPGAANDNLADRLAA